MELPNKSDDLEPSTSQNGDAQDKVTSRELQQEKLTILGNIILVSFGFMLQFTAVHGTYAIQSTVHIENNLGKISLCCHYAAAAISSLTISTALVRRFGCKSSIVGSFVTYLPYGFSQFYATPYTIIPAGIFCGLGTGPLWVGVNIYLVVMSRAYARLVNGNLHKIIWHSFGLFYMIFSCSRIIGNAILVGFATSEKINKSFTENLSDICGAHFTTAERSLKLLTLKRPMEATLNMMRTIYITFIIAACLTVWCFLDSPQRYEYSVNESLDVRVLPRFNELIATSRLIVKRKQFVMIPITFFLGCEQAFLTAGFAEAYIACSWGIPQIGYVMICVATARSISSILTGWLTSLKGGSPIYFTASVIQMSLLLYLIFFYPSTPADIPILFVVSGLWGMCQGAMAVSVNALYGILFPLHLEAAYSNFRFFEAFGLAVGFGYSPFLNIRVKLYILIGILTIGIGGYIDTEVRYRKSKREHDSVS